MGRKKASTYATLKFAYLEENLYEKIEHIYGETIKLTSLKLGSNNIYKLENAVS